MELSVEDAITKLRRGVLTIEEADAIEALLLSKIENRAGPRPRVPHSRLEGLTACGTPHNWALTRPWVCAIIIAGREK